MAEIGIESLPTATDDATIQALMQGFEYDLALTQYAFTFDPDLQLQWFICDSIAWGINGAGYCNEEMDELYYSQRYAADLEERRGFVYQIVQKLHDEVPYIQLAFLNRYEAFRNDRFSISDTDNGWMTWSWDGIWGYEQVE